MLCSLPLFALNFVCYVDFFVFTDHFHMGVNWKNVDWKYKYSAVCETGFRVVSDVEKKAEFKTGNESKTALHS